VSTKKHFTAHKVLLEKVQNAERQLESLQEGLSHPEVTDPSKDSIQGGERTEYLSTQLHQIEVLRSELNRLYELREFQHRTLWPMTETLKNSNEATVLQQKYFFLKSPAEIARFIFGEEDNFEKQQPYYKDKVSRLHTSAFAKLRKAESEDSNH